MYLQKVTSRKNFELKKLVFAGILKVNDENSRIRIQDPDPNQNVKDPETDLNKTVLKNLLFLLPAPT
jgi:hypothetical protein